MPNKESEKNLNVINANKVSGKSNEKEDQFGGTATNFKNLKDTGKTSSLKTVSKASEQKSNS